MCLQPEVIGPVPSDTARVAQAAFPKGNDYMRLRDKLGTLYTDDDFADLFSQRGQPAEAPWRLALISIFQFMEGLSDRQAADAVRSRIDWKYALGLDLTDPGFDFSVLCKFRTRLLTGSTEQGLLDVMLERFKARGWLSSRTQQRTDSTHVTAAIWQLNRLELVGETLRAALNALAVAAPEWLRAYIEPDWFDRYSARHENYRLPSKEAEREALASTIGADGFTLLCAVCDPTAPQWLRQLPAVQILRRVWLQQYYGPTDTVRWRCAEDGPPSALTITSPYDPEARCSQKRTTRWVGYRAHLTETCDPNQPHLITHVETTSATTNDVLMTTPIHVALAAKDLLPAEHLLDMGYMDSVQLVTSKEEYGVDLIGPVPSDTTWQAQANVGFNMACFTIDWEGQAATCPQGSVSKYWNLAQDRHGNDVISVQFARADCQACVQRPQCTRAQARVVTLRPREQHLALQAARQRQTTEEFREQYAKRAGIEGTLSQGIRAFELRQARYRGLAKTHLQHLLTAAAMNVVRIVAWLQGDQPAQTRVSRFAALAPCQGVT